MKKATTKKVTIKDLSDNIDSLAIIVAKGFEAVHKKFDEVDSKFTEVKKDIAEVKENLAGTRRDVLSMGDKFTLKYEFHDLASRVSVPEQKQKVKR